MVKKEATQATVIPREQGIVVWAGQHFGVDSGKVISVLKATCFKTGANEPEATDAEVAGLLIVAKAHNLNPFLREIYAFRGKNGGIVPVVGVDGWTRIINEHPQLDAFEFQYDEGEEWIGCTIYRKDRSKPIAVREFMSECKRDTGPWKSHPNRMLRHKALIQCGRIAFGFAGIHDPDEAERIVERDITPTQERVRPAALAQPSGEVVEPEVDPDQKILPAHEKVLRAAMDNATITEAELCKHFEIETLSALPFVKLNQVMEWVQNPV